MTHQLSMLDLLDPPALSRPAEPWTPPPTRKVTVTAYGGPYELTIREDDPDPIEIAVRGIACTVKRDRNFALSIARSMNEELADAVWFSTYVVGAPGSLFWSETGFRSVGLAMDDSEAIAAAIERYIKAPARNGAGCGGKLVRWWPGYVLWWQGDVSWSIRCDRATVWDQWGPERHAEIWAAHDARIVAAEARMWAEGIDPNDVGKPDHHKGRWPRFTPPPHTGETP